MEQRKRARIGIDVGGTFTDVLLFEETTGELTVEKLPSTPGDPAQAIVAGALCALEASGTAIGSVVFFAHGSTVATNALLQHRGAKVGLITTTGFRDLLAIGRQARPHLYDLQVDKPEPLVPRRLRLEARERLAYDGRVLTPLDRDDVRTAAERLGRAGVEAVAISFLHAYRNPEHELTAKSIVAATLPNVYLSVAHEILPEFREFERLNSTVVNAYLGPIVSRYVGSLERRLDELGLCCRPYMTQSNGGVISLDVAARQAVKTVLSGPSSGVVAAAALGAEVSQNDLITFDMGGTSTDVSLISQGRVALAAQRELGGYPVKTPMIDVHSVGAGGGSIAWIDPGGLLKVGPRSAGADPGPACYGRGGVAASRAEPTVTDANVLVGAANPTHLLGGRLAIDAGLAREAIAPLGSALGLDIVATARGMLSVVVANMVRAVRVISVQRGQDARRFTLVAFGGAGPLHSGALARALGIRRTLIPERPGLLCALGLLLTDLRSDFLRTRIMPTQNLDFAAVDALYAELERQASDWLAAEGILPARRVFRRVVDMRYVGQNYELQVPVSSARLDSAGLETILAAFYDSHEQTYGYAVAGEPTELVTFRVEALGLVDKAPFRRRDLAAPEPSVDSVVDRRVVYLDGGWQDTAIYFRDRLRPGNVLTGPAIVEQLDTTSLVLPGQTAKMDALGNLVIED